MAVFTTWNDLYQQMLNAIASGRLDVAELRKDGTNIRFNTMEDIVARLDYVRTMAGLESGAVKSRVIAKGKALF